MTRNWLALVALAAGRNYRKVFIVSFLLVIAAIAATTRLRLDSDVLKLLPQKDPVISAFTESLERFGAVDYLLVVVNLPEGAIPDPYESYADALAERLLDLEEVESLEYKLGEPVDLLRTALPKAMLFLDDGARAELETRLDNEGLGHRARELRRLVTTPQSIALKELLKVDPFGLAEIFFERVNRTQGALSIDWSSGYYLSQDHRQLLLLTKPTSPPQDTDFDARLVIAVEGAVAAAEEDWRRIVGDGEGVGDGGDEGDFAPPKVSLGGPYLTALDDFRFIRRDMVVNSVTSLAAVLLIFLFAFRRWSPLLFAFVPLVGGLLLTFGFSALTVGTLNSATSGTAALLIGLGIDFVIVSYGRYVEERRRGRSVEEALELMSGSSGRAVVVGAVTTAATFFAFLVTDFSGLRQMGFLTGTGILFCMVAVLVVLPALIAWGEKRHQRRMSDPRLYLHSFGAGGMVRFGMRRPVLTLSLSALVTAGALWAAAGIEFEEGMSAMRPEKGNRGIDVAEEVATHFRTGFDSMSLMLRADTLDEVFALTEKASDKAQALVDEGVLYGQTSIVDIIPTPSRQRRALDWLAAGRADGRLDGERIESHFRSEMESAGLRATPFDDGIELFRQSLSVEQPIAPEDLSSDKQSSTLLDRFLQPDGDRWLSVVTLFPPLNEWRREAPPEAVALADSLGPDAILTGANVVNQHLRARVRKDAVAAAVVGLLLVTILLWIDFRSLRSALLSLAPLLIGMVWMLGAMGLLGLKMNFMNIFVTTMIIGIGVDYGIHVVHRYRESSQGGSGDLSRALGETSNAIVLAALSTVAGFGTLSLSHYPGLQSTGKVAILGALATALVSITVLPAWFALREKSSRS